MLQCIKKGSKGREHIVQELAKYRIYCTKSTVSEDIALLKYLGAEINSNSRAEIKLELTNKDFDFYKSIDKLICQEKIAKLTK